MIIRRVEVEDTIIVKFSIAEGGSWFRRDDEDISWHLKIATKVLATRAKFKGTLSFLWLGSDEDI